MVNCEYCGLPMQENNSNDKFVTWKCNNKKCSYHSKRSKLQSWFIVLGLFILLGVGITATTIINNNGMTTGTVTTTGNVSALYFVGNGQYLTGISAGNLSWNETRANLIYAPIKWDYNQTIAAGSDYAYNQTTATNTLYGLWWYNQTTGTYDLYGLWWYNHTQAANESIYNTYNAAWSSTYNETYSGLINNASYLSTYNGTYATWSYNQSTYVLTYVNANFVNTTGDQTITGLKKFVSLPQVENLATAPSDDKDLVTKYYVDNLAALSIAWKDPVTSINDTVEPASPTTGMRYIVNVTGGVGNWTDRGNNITTYNGTGWAFTQPANGWALLVLNINQGYVWNNVSWVSFTQPVTYTGTNGVLLDGSAFKADLSSTGGLNLSGTGIGINYNSTVFAIVGNKLTILQAGLSIYNATYDKWAYNQTTAVSANSYNHTIAANNSIVTVYNALWSSTYNVTYAGLINNASYLSTYNATYAGLIQNATYLSTYNATYAGLMNNASYLSTYNETYKLWAYNTSQAANVTIFDAYGKWWYNQTDGSYNASYDKWAYNTTLAGQGYYLNLSGTNANQNINIGANNISANYGSKFGNSTQYITFDYLDLSGLGFGVYSVIKGVTNGILGNVTAIKNALVITAGDEEYGGIGLSNPSISLINGTDINSANILYNISSSNLEIDRSLVPSTSELFSLGSDALRWLSGYFINLYVSGNITASNINSISYVQSSNGSDLKSKIESCSNCIVSIPTGFYNVDDDIQIGKNVTINGQGKVVINFSDTFNFNSQYGSDLSNLKFSNLELIGELPKPDRGYNTTDSLFNLTGYNSIDGFEMKDIKIENYNGTAIHLSLKSDATGVGKNIEFNGINMLEVRDGIRIMQDGTENKDKFINVKVEDYYLYDNTYYNAFYSNTYIGYGIYAVGLDQCTFNNIHTRKAADGPTIKLFRSKNCEISNIYSIDQHDYAVSINDENKNININNIYVENPRGWGLLYISTPDYVTPQVVDNIYASNLQCINCSNGNLFQYPIYINVDDSDESGGNSINNIIIDNFKIDKSSAYSAIQIEPNNGTINGLTIRNGYINNTNNTAIRFYYGYKISNVNIENNVFENIGGSATNDDVNSTIYFQIANTSNINIQNNNFINEKSNHSITMYAHSTNTPTTGYLDIYGINNKNLHNIKSFYNQGDFYIDNYNYNNSLQTKTCSATSVFNGRTIFNLTSICTCLNSAWQCRPMEGTSALVSGNLSIENINKSGFIFPNANGISSKDVMLYMPFDNNVNDYSGVLNSYPSINGTLSKSIGRFGGSYLFNGNNGSVSITSNSLNLSGLQNFSVSYLVNNYLSGAGCVIGNGWAGQRNFNSLTNVGTSSSFRIFNETTSATASGPSPVANQWYHFVGTYDGTTVKAYVNGKLSGSAVLGGNMNTTTGNVTIGACVANTNLNGTLDELILFNRTLSSEEIKSLYEKDVEFVSKDASYNNGQDINPILGGIYNIGSSAFRWLSGWFVNIDVSGNATINQTLRVGYNATMNSTGIYHSDSKAFARTADVVVCRGTSALDDLIKSFQCDVVCKSSDDDCGSKINNSIYSLSQSGGGTIYLGKGNFTVNTYINPQSNIRVLGSGSATVLYLSGTDEVFRHTTTELIKNFELGNIKMWTNKSGLTVGFDLPEVPSDNIYLHDIDFGNLNYDSFRISTNSLATDWHTNIIVERIKSSNCSFIVGKTNGFKLSDSSFNNSASSRNILGDLGFSENNAELHNALIEHNYFYNLKSTNFALGSSENITGLKIKNNVFVSNGTSYVAVDDNTDYFLDLLIEGNTFYTGDTLGGVIIDINSRDPKSSVLIKNNYFIEENGRYRGIRSDVHAIFDGNTFTNLGDMCIQSLSNTLITNNKFYNCAVDQSANRWLYLSPSANYTTISDNKFIASSVNTNTVIRLQGSSFISSYDNTYQNINSLIYTLDGGVSGVEYNSSYLEDYAYGQISGIACSNNPINVTFEKTIHNATAQCTCIAGAWKCTNFGY